MGADPFLVQRPRHRQPTYQCARGDAGRKALLQERPQTSPLPYSADGFYEWKKEGTARQPLHIRRADGDLFALAGLWEEWKQPDGALLRTCTIVTVAPNELMLSIHDRMPAILAPEAEAAWLDTTQPDLSALLTLLKPYPAEAMEAFAVSRRVNAPTIDDPTLLNFH